MTSFSCFFLFFFFFNDTATTEIYTFSLHDALPISALEASMHGFRHAQRRHRVLDRSEEHTSELQSRQYLVCRLLLEKKKKKINHIHKKKKKKKNTLMKNHKTEENL